MIKNDVKKCRKCGKVKLLTKFSKDKGKKDGYSWHCKECKNEYYHQYRSEHLEKEKVRGRKWKKENPKTVKILVKRWRENNPERYLEMVRKGSRKFQKTEKGRRVTKASTANMIASKHMINDKISAKDVKSIEQSNIKKFGKLSCDYCGVPISETGKAYHLEHKVPYERGGTNLKRNLCVSCDECNRRKNNKTAKEYKELLKVEMIA